VLIGSVVHDEVDEDAHAALLAAPGEFNKVAEGAVAGVDAVVICYVVSVVAIGRGLKGHEPEGGDAEALQVVEAAQETLEVADAVSVCIHVSGNGEAVDDGVLVPEIVDHARALSGDC
jgi:hypothetical protein